MQHEQKPNNDDHDGQGNKKDSQIAPVTATAIAVWIFIFGLALLWLILRDYIPDRAESLKIFIESVFSLALVIVVVIQTAIYFRQARALDAQQAAMEGALKATRDSLTVAQNSLKIGMRGYLGIRSIDLDLVKKKRLSVHLENIGKVPADKIKAFISVAISNPEEWMEQKVRHWAKAEREYDFGLTSIYPGTQPAEIGLWLQEYFSDDEIAHIGKGKTFVSVALTIKYWDGFEFSDARFLLTSKGDNTWMVHPSWPTKGASKENENTDDEKPN